MIPPPSAGDDLLAKTGYTLAKIAFRKPANPLDFSIKEKLYRKVLMEGNYMTKVHRFEQLKLDNFRLAMRLSQTRSGYPHKNLKFDAKKQMRNCNRMSKEK